MVIDSTSTRRSKEDRSGNNSRKKPIPKGESCPVSAPAKAGSSSLRRLTRGTPAKEQITSTSSAVEAQGKASKLIDSSSLKKSERLEKKDTSPPVKRKLEVLEREKSSSPLRRSDRGKKNPSLASSDSNNRAKATASPDVNMKKLRKEKSVKDLPLEAMERIDEAKSVERRNGQIRKTMNGHIFKALFAPQQIIAVMPVLDEDLERLEKLSEDGRACFGVGVLGDGEDGVKECSEKIEQECVDRDCEGGKEQSVPKSNNVDTLTLSNHENDVNAINGSMIYEEVIEDSGKLQVDNASVVELQTPEVEILPDNNVVEGTGIAFLPSSECEKDKFVGICTSCCKRRRLNNNKPAQESCLCSIVPINDSLKTSRSEDGVIHPRCDDSHNDALNDDNLSTYDICTVDGELPPDSSKFVEYWVPVSISNVQLEHYCATLLSNSMTLLAASSSKDIVGTLHDILVSTKKCCNHPYFMDKELQGFLTKGLPEVEYLGVGIKASGKLQLLDSVLSEIRSQGKRVLILYQSIRYAEMLTGDILDDYLRQRFGSDSYERVEGGIVQLKKQTALNKFNDKDGGRFVFLLEKRACTSAIKLLSLDAIVIFDSDWNIKSDNRALHKLSIVGSPEPIKVFRLYTFCTLEEKVLELASEHVTLDSNLQSINRTTCHLLLMWGASYLFSKLDEFHSGSTSNSGLSLCPDVTMEKDLAGELLDIIIHDADNSCKNTLITKVQLNEGSYSKNAPLYGHLKGQSTDGEAFHQFWNELLGGKNPRWRFLPVQMQRIRKRLNLPKNPDGEPDEVTKKKKKIVKRCADVASPLTRHTEAIISEAGSLVVSPKSTASIPFSSKNISLTSEAPIAGSEEGTKIFDLQKNLHGLLKHTISELSELLQIPEDVKTMGEMFLEYIVNNHQISREPKSILQAFQISLIWIAASLLSYNLDRKQLLDVAKQQLGFRCTEDDVINVFTKLCPLRKTFKKSSQKFKELESKKDFSEDPLKKIQRKCEKRKMRLLRKHEEEIQELNRIWEEERAQMHSEHRAESAVIRAMYLYAPAVRSDKIKRVDDVFAKKLDEHNLEKKIRLQELKRKQLDEVCKEDQKAGRWLKHAQGNIVSVSGEKESIDLTEVTEVAPSSIPITMEIPTIPSEKLYEPGTMEKQLGNLCSDDTFGNSVVSGDLTSTAELVPDGIVSGAQETDENALNEYAGEAKCSDTSKPDGESNKDNNPRNDINISDPDQTEICNDTAGSLINGDIRTVSSLVTSPSMPILEGTAQDVASLQNLVPEDECSMPSISVGILDDAIKCENTYDLEQAGDTNRPSTVPDHTTLGAQEAVENAPNKFAGGTMPPDTSKPDGESNEDNSLRNVIYISDSDSTEYCTDAAGSSRQDGICRVQPLVRSPSVKILKAPAQDIVPLQNLVELQDESRPSISAGILDGNATGCKSTNTLEQVENENHTSTEEQIPDCITSGAQGTVENAADEFTRDAKSPDSSKPGGESNGDNNLLNNGNISDSCPTKNCIDAAGSSKNDGICTMPPSVISPSVQIQAPDEDVESLQNLVSQSECSRPSISDGALDRVATECEDNNVLDQAATEKIPDCITSSAQEAVGNAPNELENTNTLEQAPAEKIPDCITSGAQETIENSPDEFENANTLEQATSEKIPDCITSSVLEAVENVPNEFENTNTLEQAAAEKIPDCITSSVQEAVENAPNEFENTNTLEQAAAEKIPDCITSSVQEAVENAPNEIELIHALQQAEVEHPSLPDPENGEQSTIQFVENLLPLPPLRTQIVDEIMNDDATQMGIPPPTDIVVEGSRTHRFEELPPSQNGEQSTMQFVENLIPPFQSQIIDEIMNVDGTQMRTPPSADIPVVGSRTHHHPSHPSQYIDLRPQSQPSQAQASHLDPLQIELDRLHKEKEAVTKLHEVAKLELKSEYEKELERVVADLRRKYEAKLKGAEAEVLQKKKELDSHQTKVFMNRILAETFRAKCLEFRPSTSSGTYKVKSTNFLEQLLSQAAHPRRTNPPYIVPPAASPQIAGPSVPRPSPTIPNMQMRPPHTLPNITRPIGNFPISGEIRAMAPHLRPPSSTSAPSPAQGLPSQDQRRRPPFSVRPQMPVPPQYNRVPQPENMSIRNPGAVPPQHNRVPQHDNMGIHNHVPVPPQHNRVPQPENMGMRNPVHGTNFVGLYLSRGGAQGGDRGIGRGVNVAQSSVVNDVVCLSDDEL